MVIMNPNAFTMMAMIMANEDLDVLFLEKDEEATCGSNEQADCDTGSFNTFLNKDASGESSYEKSVTQLSDHNTNTPSEVEDLSKNASRSFPAEKILRDGLIFVGYKVESINRCGKELGTNR